MIEIDKTRTVVLVQPSLADKAAFTNGYLDTAGFGHVRFEFIIGTLDAIIGSTDTSTAPFVEECDTTDGSYTAVSGAALAAVIGATGDDVIRAIDVDLTKGHKRYMRVNAPTAGDGTTGCNLCIIGRLSRPEGGFAMTATAQGLTELVKA